MAIPKIKICGITNLNDALLCANLGAGALGFIFAPSPRQIEKKLAAQIISALPPFITCVGVFVNDSVESVNETVLECGLTAVQLHGEESPEFCARIMTRVIKTFRLGKDAIGYASINEELGKYEPLVSAFLFDTYSPDKYGGTGKAFEWSFLGEIQTNKPIIVSGGLNPDNIGELLALYTPYAVDLSSGVEASPGQKDPEKLKAIFHA